MAKYRKLGRTSSQRNAPQDTLVRVALMATHTKEQIDRAVEKLVKAFKALDIL